MPSNITKKDAAKELFRLSAALFLQARKLRGNGSYIDAYNTSEKVIAMLEDLNDRLVPNYGAKK
jgi:hypothetical protein